MSLRKCCVGNCSSTNRTDRLYYLPKDDNLRQLWLSSLVQTSIELSGLSKEQLSTKRVCQKHFNRYQFDSMGNRLRTGYPCLFTAKELDFGTPLSSTGDHSYKSAGSQVPELVDNQQQQTAKEQVELPSPIQRTAKNVSRHTCFVKKLKRQALAAEEKSFSERLAAAETLNQDCKFLHFHQMNKQAQNFIMMQLKLVNKKKTAVRFTSNEKLLALTLMKESLKGYTLLQKIRLPSKRTLNRLAEKISFGVGINENIIRLIESPWIGILKRNFAQLFLIRWLSHHI